MSRRRLVQRSLVDGVGSSPVQISRPEPNEQASAAVLDLHGPHYPLSAEAKNKLSELHLHHDFSKYKKSIKDATNLITKSTYECNDRLWQRKQKLQALKERIKTSENLDERFRSRYETDKDYTSDFEKKVEDITIKAEIALRDLIDYSDELSNQANLMIEVATRATTSSTTPCHSTVNSDSDAETLKQDDSLSGQSIPKCVDFFRNAKKKNRAQYESRSLRERYADHNDYKNFKGMIHDAQNQGPNARPLEHPKYWFSRDQPQINQSQRQPENEQIEDDEIIMTSVTTNLKCSFTLQYFKEPYSNRKCKHTYEKSAILDYLNTEGVVYSQAGRRGIPQGNKRITCPTPGCSVTLELDDFYLDERIQQQVIKAKRFEATDDSPDNSDEDVTQPRRSARQVVLDDDDDDGNISKSNDEVVASID